MYVRHREGDRPVLGVSGHRRVQRGRLRTCPTLPLRLLLTCAAVFGSLALILSAVDLFGTVTYLVQTRTRDLAIHMALGCSPERRHPTTRGVGAAGVMNGWSLGLARRRHCEGQDHDELRGEPAIRPQRLPPQA